MQEEGIDGCRDEGVRTHPPELSDADGSPWSYARDPASIAGAVAYTAVYGVLLILLDRGLIRDARKIIALVRDRADETGAADENGGTGA